MAAIARKPAKKTTRTKAAPIKKSTPKAVAKPVAKKTATKKATPARAPETSDLTRRMVAAAAAACEEKKAFDTRILELDASDSSFTDFFLITSGQNTRQVQAIADAVEEALRAAKVGPSHIEGYDRAE